MKVGAKSLFNEIKKKIQDERKRRCCDEDDEEQEVTHAPTMEWDMGDKMNNIRIYAV